MDAAIVVEYVVNTDVNKERGVLFTIGHKSIIARRSGLSYFVLVLCLFKDIFVIFENKQYN